MTRHSSFSIIIPAYNEKQGIRQTVLEIHKVFRNLGYKFEIIIVNDGSSDGTKEVLDLLCLEFIEVKVLDLQHNYGKGHAVKEGAAYSEGDYVVFMDADLDIHPSQIKCTLEMFKSKKSDNNL